MGAGVTPTKVKTICTHSCTWIFTSGGWTVLLNNCTAPCGCSASTLVPPTSSLLPNGEIRDKVDHADFLAVVSLMASDLRVPKYPKNPTLTTTLPAVGTTYEMPCVA